MDDDKRLSLVDDALAGEIIKTRADEAYDRKIAGQPLSEIAEQLGYHDANEVAQAIRQRMQREAAFLEESERDGILQLELIRLDRLQMAQWQSAMYGDPKATDLVLKIMAMRQRITGVDQPDALSGARTVLVVGGNEENYVQKLKDMSDG